MILNKKRVMLLSALLFSLPTITFAATMDCPSDFAPGIYTGYLTNLIDKASWPHTNYIMETVEGAKGCVQDTQQSPTRNKIIYNAFLLNSKVTVQLGEVHTILGIGLQNDE